MFVTPSGRCRNCRAVAYPLQVITTVQTAIEGDVFATTEARALALRIVTAGG